MVVYSGAAADQITVAGGLVEVTNAALISSSTVNGGHILVRSGGRAASTNVASGGSMVVYGGGTADRITMLGGLTEIMNSAQISSSVLSRGFILVHSGGKAVSAGHSGS